MELLKRYISSLQHFLDDEESATPSLLLRNAATAAHAHWLAMRAFDALNELTATIDSLRKGNTDERPIPRDCLDGARRSLTETHDGQRSLTQRWNDWQQREWARQQNIFNTPAPDETAKVIAATFTDFLMLHGDEPIASPMDMLINIAADNVKVLNADNSSLALASTTLQMIDFIVENFDHLATPCPKEGELDEEEALRDTVAQDWARKFFDKLNTIYPTKERLAVKAANIRRLYLDAAKNNEGKPRWLTPCIKELFYPDQRDKQWLKDSTMPLDILKELIDDPKITKDTLSRAKKDYKFLGNK